MTDFREAQEDPKKVASNTIKATGRWSDDEKPATGRPDPHLDAGLDSDRMTEGQRSYLAKLCEETGENFDEDMSIAQATQRIHELEQKAPHPS